MTGFQQAKTQHDPVPWFPRGRHSAHVRGGLVLLTHLSGMIWEFHLIDVHQAQGKLRFATAECIKV